MIDEVRTGKYKSLFHPETLVNGKEDAANNCKCLCAFGLPFEEIRNGGDESWLWVEVEVEVKVKA